MSENVIELNGKRYDALTGKMLGVSHTRIAETLAPAKPAFMPTIDGFVRPTVAQHLTKTKPSAVTTIKATAPSKMAGHKTAKAAAAHQPQHAKTLMRRTVHKPSVSLKPKLKTQVPAEIAAKSPSAIAVKRSAGQIDPRRKAHAGSVVKHSAVKHFHQPHAQVLPATLHVPKPPTTIPHIPVKTAPASQHQSAHKDMFEAAIAHANSHQQPAHKPRRSPRRRMANTMAGVAAFLVIGSFFAWLNLPNIQLHVASIQAGFKAEMPHYTPTGYALEGGVQRFGNTVSMNYRSGASQFQITQQPSDWNSQTLLENTSALSQEHKTLQVNGRTVYVYGEGNAAWVDHGVRYDVTGNAALDAKDIEHIVSSL